MLVWLQEIGNAATLSPQWTLGVASDQHNLTTSLVSCIGTWTVLLVTYLLIGVLGALAMRSIGRAYERKLEARSVNARGRWTPLTKMCWPNTPGDHRTDRGCAGARMRNPLASIKLAFSGLQSRDDMPERTRRRLDLVLGEVTGSMPCCRRRWS